MKFKISLGQNIFLLICSIILMVLLLEFTVRIYDFKKGLGFFNSKRNLMSNHYTILPFRSFGFDIYKNQNGIKYISSRWKNLYSIKKESDVFRIVCIGGSTTEDRYSHSKFGFDWPKLLENNLNSYYPNKKIEVINLGYAAYATPHFLVLLNLDVISWNADVIIISENINDLVASYWPNITYDYSNKYANEIYNPLAKLLELRHSFWDLLFQHFNIYWIARNKIDIIRKQYKMRKRSYGDYPPKLGTEIFVRNLESFIAICHRYGIKVIMGTQPLEPSQESRDFQIEFKPYNDIVVYPLHKEFIKHHQFYNNCIKQIAKRHNVYLIDNDNILKGDKKYFIDFVHYSKEGSTKMANNYTEFIIKNNLIKN